MPAVRTDDKKIAEVRRVYEGVGHTEDDCATMVVEAMGEMFGVHPNSISTWAKTFGWRRPEWYRQRRPRSPNHSASAAALEALLRTLIGLPMPSDHLLGRKLGCSGPTIGVRLRDLVADRRLRLERQECLRRAVFPDGQATDWSGHKRSAHVTMAAMGLMRTPAAAEDTHAGRRLKLKRGQLLELARRYAERALPMPRLADLAQHLGLPGAKVRALFDDLAKADAIRLDERSGGVARQYRVTFPDGKATPWPAPVGPPGGDVVAREAARRLRQRGLVVFDTGVHGGEWGQRWAIDGKIVGRTGLLEAAGWA